MLGSIIQIVLEQPTNMGVTSTIDLSISADLEMVSKGATAEPFFTIGKFFTLSFFDTNAGYGIGVGVDIGKNPIPFSVNYDWDLGKSGVNK